MENKEKITKAQFGSPDRPLKIGKLEIPCYVLDNGKRVLVQRGMIMALGMALGGGRAQNLNKLTQFIDGKRISPFISKDILVCAKSPIKFKLPNGTIAHGYEATLLPDICNAVLEAREKGALLKSQLIIAKQCEILVRGFATIGIIALIDEATGYQEIRDREALQKILDKYITGEWAKWTKTFPDDFYRQLFRLKGMTYPPTTKNKPSFIGHWTNNIVYSRLAPGVVKKLKELNPRNSSSGERARKHFQYMTPSYGTPELRKHLDNLIFLMKGCTAWSDFYKKLNRASPKYGDQISLDLPEKRNEGDE
ncbi:MAG TPA: P63C domain-containing protein [Chitinispirillaceae bacterium]|nr:P63C domain-containing protein [Chitinispirillaceae bacterium]